MYEFSDKEILDFAKNNLEFNKGVFGDMTLVSVNCDVESVHGDVKSVFGYVESVFGSVGNVGGRVGGRVYGSVGGKIKQGE